MSSKTGFVLVLVSLILIFGTQIFLINDYYNTTRAAWTKESNAILEEAFRADLTIRNDQYRETINESTVVIAPTIPDNDEMTVVDLTNVKATNVVSGMDMIIHLHISPTVPLDLHRLDSITSSVMKMREIQSNFTVNIINQQSGELFESSRVDWQSSLFMISSEPMLIDAANSIALQLHLINPFQIIIKRMGLMLVSSLVLSLICLLAFMYVQKVLARQKQLVAFKNEFLGTIAHELKRPVSSLTFNLDCLSMSAASLDTPQNSLLLNNSIRATDELNDAINMIVTLSKLEEGMLILNKERVDLLDIVEDLKDKFSEQRFKNKQVAIVLEVTGDLPVIDGDRQLLTQCFANLIDNAIKYSGDDVRILIHLQAEDQQVSVGIQDNGFGIPEDKLELVFDKYSRVHQSVTQIKGFGIGLNYVKNIVEQHKGEVKVSSQIGVGSEFKVVLPAN